jgi:hypothetical protein
MSGEGYVQDVLTRIMNVQWGGEGIVVFMEVSQFYVQPVFELTVKFDEDSGDEKATFLGTWETPTYSTDPIPLKNTAYKVKGDAVFLTSKAPKLPFIDPDHPVERYDENGTWLNVLVFNKDLSLEDVTDATKLMAPALCIVNALNEDLPTEVAPPGLLWAVRSGAFAAGVSIDWKMRFGAHRIPESGATLPDAMVQCYPLCESHPGYIGATKVTYSGYFLIAYRLDKDGTDTVYSKAPKITDVGITQNLPLEWNVTIVFPTVISEFPQKGIPFADPPPLITADVE